MIHPQQGKRDAYPCRRKGFHAYAYKLSVNIQKHLRSMCDNVEKHVKIVQIAQKIIGSFVQFLSVAGLRTQNFPRYD